MQSNILFILELFISEVWKVLKTSQEKQSIAWIIRIPLFIKSSKPLLKKTTNKFSHSFHFCLIENPYNVVSSNVKCKKPYSELRKIKNPKTFPALILMFDCRIVCYSLLLEMLIKLISLKFALIVRAQRVFRGLIARVYPGDSGFMIQDSWFGIWYMGYMVFGISPSLYCVLIECLRCCCLLV